MSMKKALHQMPAQAGRVTTGYGEAVSIVVTVSFAMPMTAMCM